MKIAVVTPFFPVPEQLYRGHSAYQALRRLNRLAVVNVLCPLTRYPSWFQPRNFDHVRCDINYSPADLPAQYFEYPALPGLTRPMNGEICARYLRPKLRALQPDIVLNYWLYPEGYAAVRVARELGVPVVVRAIGSDLNRIPDAITRWMVRRTMHRADAVLTASDALREVAIREGVPGNKIHAVPNGCDINVFHRADRRQARASLGAHPDARLLLFVGRLDPKKGIVELVQAAAQCAAHHPNLEVVYVGTGSGADAIKSEAQQLGIPQRVRLAGMQDSRGVAQWLAAADLLCLPSYAEGCPNVVIESLACGRPVVASRVGGIAAMVDESCSVLLPPKDPSALAAGINRALERTWDEAAISARWRRSWDDVAAEMFQICLSLLPAFQMDATKAETSAAEGTR